jgi:hypothetical protein
MKRVLPLILVAAARVAHADDTAALAYQQADQLEKQGKLAEACPLYEASYRADPQIGVLLHLADCHERIGKVASAWAEFTDVVELAHRRGDNREALAQQRADALKPKLAYLHLAAPASPPPGIAVTRDGLDVTVLVGTDMPIDPGDHEIIATAPGFIDWTKKLTIGSLPTTTKLAIPALVKRPADAVPVPVTHEGGVVITTQPGAHVSIDGVEVGVGGYRGKQKSGGHQLRITAPGMRPYQSEIFVGDGESRTIDVPLEAEPAAIVIAPAAPAEQLPSFEVGLGFAPGEKGYGDHPAVLSYRLDFGFRLGRRVDLGAFVEYSSISATGSCGTALPGPTPAGPFDYGTRDRFTGCSAIAPGLQLYVHIMPKRQWDPWVGLAPAFRIGLADYTSYASTGMPGVSSSITMPGILVGVRAGVDYHPYARLAGWAIGAFVDSQITVIASENAGHSGAGDSVHYVSWYGGLRTSLAF